MYNYLIRSQKYFLSVYRIVFICIVLFFAAPQLFAELAIKDSTTQISNHTVTLKDPSNQPFWKEIWDNARLAVKMDDKEKAISLYRKLFAAKPHIEEALREYAIILMEQEQWSEAGQIIQKLLEVEPASQEYLLYGGRTALAQQRYERASSYLGQVYSMSPDGKFANEALQGQITALQNLGRSVMAYPLMEQLYQLVPHNENSIRQLALYSNELGFKGKAVNYYKTLISEFGGTDTDFLKSVPLFEEMNETEMLVLAWQGYLKTHPYYLPFHKKLSEYYLKNGLEEEALEHLLVLIALGEQKADIFLQAGKIYLYQKSRPDKALYYYEEYRKRNPADKNVTTEIERIQAILANDLLVIVENEGAWNLWRDLAKVIPDRLAVYYSMAEQLEEMHKYKELLEVLEIIHTHESDDQEIVFRLAQLYYEKGELAAATEKLDLLVESRQQGKHYFLIRAEISEATGVLVESLAYYKKYLNLVSADHRVLLNCIKLSGQIGSVDDLQYFYSHIVRGDFSEEVLKEASFSYGQGLLLNNLYTRAELFYRELSRRFTLTKQEVLEVNFTLATILQHENRLYESEELLRQALLKYGATPQVLIKLIRISLLQEDLENCWKWYKYFVINSNTGSGWNVHENPQLLLVKVDILQGSGQEGVAIEILEDFFAENIYSDHKDEQCELIRLKLAELYYYENKYFDAASIMANRSQNAKRDIYDKILSLLIEKKRDRISDKTARESLLSFSSSNVFESAVALAHYGEFGLALQLCERYLQESPDSLRAKTLQADLQRDLGQDFAALESFKQLYESYPGEVSFKQNILELQFKASKFKQLVEELAPEWKAIKGKETEVSVRKVVPDVATLPVTQRLLLARALWADKRASDALALYKELLQPQVEVEFTSQLAEQEITLKLPEPQKTLLNIVTFTSPPKLDKLGTVMDPDFIRRNFEKPELVIAAGLYSKYRWQKIIKRELAVRKDMSEGNYYQAMKEYQSFLNDDTSPESLYDLAGIYSRLGFLGKEAALYEQIKVRSPGYPDLDEAIQRNSLKREPRVTPAVMFSEKEGRDGYYDIRQNGGGFKGWFMPSLNHEVLIAFNRIYSSSNKVDESLWRNNIKAEVKWSPIYDLDLVFAVGQEKPDDDFESTFLYDFYINGRIGDIVQGYFGLSRNIVDDTLDAVKQGINTQEYEGGITLDFLPRLFGGAEYVYTDYSDDNHRSRYEFWSSYTIFSEPTHLQLRYGYEYINSATGNLKRDYSIQSGFAPEDHPYWSPENYYQHLFTISFEHQLAEDILGRGAPSYYTLEYSFGYERGGYDNHGANAQIFLEMSRHFLLNSSFEFTRGAEFQEIGFFCSAIYRW